MRNYARLQIVELLVAADSWCCALAAAYLHGSNTDATMTKALAMCFLQCPIATAITLFCPTGRLDLLVWFIIKSPSCLVLCVATFAVHRYFVVPPVLVYCDSIRIGVVFIVVMWFSWRWCRYAHCCWCWRVRWARGGGCPHRSPGRL